MVVDTVPKNGKTGRHFMRRNQLLLLELLLHVIVYLIPNIAGIATVMALWMLMTRIKWKMNSLVVVIVVVTIDIVLTIMKKVIDDIMNEMIVITRGDDMRMVIVLDVMMMTMTTTMNVRRRIIIIVGNRTTNVYRNDVIVMTEVKVHQVEMENDPTVEGIRRGNRNAVLEKISINTESYEFVLFLFDL
jgi:hypothetical protein